MRGQVKFRIGRIVWLALSRDGSTMGFAFPKELRNALVESDPDKFSLPSKSDMRYHWVHVRLAAIDADEMRELVEDAWAFCVPKRVAEEYAVSQGYLESGTLESRGRLAQLGEHLPYKQGVTGSSPVPPMGTAHFASSGCAAARFTGETRFPPCAPSSG